MLKSLRSEYAAARDRLERREQVAKAAVQQGKKAAHRAMRALGSEAAVALAEAGHTEAVQAIGAGVAAGLWGVRWAGKAGCSVVEIAKAAYNTARQQAQPAELKTVLAEAAQNVVVLLARHLHKQKQHSAQQEEASPEMDENTLCQGFSATERDQLANSFSLDRRDGQTQKAATLLAEVVAHRESHAELGLVGFAFESWSSVEVASCIADHGPAAVCAVVLAFMLQILHPKEEARKTKPNAQVKAIALQPRPKSAV